MAIAGLLFIIVLISKIGISIPATICQLNVLFPIYTFTVVAFDVQSGHSGVIALTLFLRVANCIENRHIQ
ncbi:hypothetical protein F4782DRAFT_498520 [Xylaria castorea]|nr:hypothetical protein F4782DRAFT_498520 [Xylaria castorea]